MHLDFKESVLVNLQTDSMDVSLTPTLKSNAWPPCLRPYFHIGFISFTFKTLYALF